MNSHNSENCRYKKKKEEPSEDEEVVATEIAECLKILLLLGSMLLRSIFDEEEYYVLFSMIEACYAITIIYDQFKLVRWRVSDGKLNLVFYDGRHVVPPVKNGKALLSCLQVYPCRWLILSKIMWSMYSIAMLVCNDLRCFGVIYCPFQYGVVALFCMPRIKKPPDPNLSGELTLVEGIINLNNLPCNKHFSF